MHEVSATQSEIDISSLYVESVSTVSKEPEGRAWHKNTFAHNEEICFKLVTAAEENILPLSIFTGKKMYALPI